MRIKNLIIIVLSILLLSGCNIELFGTNRPEGISKKYYDMFVESYEIYEERVLKYNGDFLDENNELIEFENGPPGALTESDIASTYRDDMKKIEDGKPEQVKLTEKENQLHGDFLKLYSLKSWDFFNPD